jgi:hypothetical protein
MIRQGTRLRIIDKESYACITENLGLYFQAVVTLFRRIYALSIETFQVKKGRADS